MSSKTNKVFSLYIKMTNNYYQQHKEKLRKESREKYQNFTEEEKEKQCQYHDERHRNLSEE